MRAFSLTKSKEPARFWILDFGFWIRERGRRVSAFELNLLSAGHVFGAVHPDDVAGNPAGSVRTECDEGPGDVGGCRRPAGGMHPADSFDQLFVAEIGRASCRERGEGGV